MAFISNALIGNERAAKVHNFGGISNKENVFSNKFRNFADQKSCICPQLIM